MSNELTPDRLREIERRCEAATKAPWQTWDETIAPQRITDATGEIDALLDCSEDARGFNRVEDARLCSHARQDIPDLLAALKHALEERDGLAAAVEEARLRLQHIQNCKRPPDITQEHFIFCLQENASLALVNIADPAECLKARKALAQIEPQPQSTPSEHTSDRALGFVLGQAATYCERVRTGGSLIAEFGCPNVYLEEVLRLIAGENCQHHTSSDGDQRTTIHIYRDDRALVLLDSANDAWAMGKLFGYGDRDVLDFIRAQNQPQSKPKQQLPVEDPPFNACTCPACLAVRATIRKADAARQRRAKDAGR